MTIPKRILLLRADAIGDHILAAGLIPLLKRTWPGSRITVLCPSGVAGLFEACPSVDRLIPFNPRRLRRLRYRVLLRLKLHERFDLALNTVFSRDAAVDRLAGLVRATRFVAFQGDTCNQPLDALRKGEKAYTELVKPPPGPLHALDSLQAMARHLGLEGAVQPQVWVSEGDLGWARSRLQGHADGESPWLAFFPGAGSPIRHYPRYAEALSGFLASHEARLVALGATADRAWCGELLGRLPGHGHLNLCGETTLGQAAAILSLSRLAAGAETGLAHMAWAVGTPHVVVLGGGHFGRFMPGSGLSSAAVLPMDCFGCNWQCRFDRPLCIQELPPSLLEAALTQAWEGASPESRLYFPDPSPLSSHGCGIESLALPPRTAVLAVPCGSRP